MPKMPLAPNVATVFSAVRPVPEQSDGTAGKRLSPMICTGTELARLAGNLHIHRDHGTPTIAIHEHGAFHQRVAVGRAIDRQAQRERRCQQAKPVGAGIDQNVVDGLALGGMPGTHTVTVV